MDGRRRLPADKKFDFSGTGRIIGRVNRGNFPLQFLTEPYVNLSIHTALAIQPLIGARVQCAKSFGAAFRTRASQRKDSVRRHTTLFLRCVPPTLQWLTHSETRTARPLRSTPITEASSLLWVDPTLTGASVLCTPAVTPRSHYSLFITGKFLAFLRIPGRCQILHH